MQPVKLKPNKFHAAAMLYLVVSALAGIGISGSQSPNLQAKGWYIFHAYIAFMGFGTMMILGHQRELVVKLLQEHNIANRSKPGDNIFIPMNVCLWIVWACYLAQGLTKNDLFYFPALVLGFVILGCLTVFVRDLYFGIPLKVIGSNIPLRFFATSLFMCYLAYGQMVHVTINEIEPVLPFSETIALRNNYLAFSFPISLTIMGSFYMPYFKKYESGEIKSKLVWEAQYAILVSGVFSLFGAILFDQPGNEMFHGIMAVLQTAFSAVLVFSIVVFALGIFRDRRAVVDTLPPHVFRFLSSAIFYLSLAGLAGLALGYGVDKKTDLFYLMIQGHVHLALLGWVGMGITGAFHYILYLGGRTEPTALDNAHYYLLHVCIISMTAGIFLLYQPFRIAAGVSLVLSIILLMKSVFTPRSYAG